MNKKEIQDKYDVFKKASQMMNPIKNMIENVEKDAYLDFLQALIDYIPPYEIEKKESKSSEVSNGQKDAKSNKKNPKG